MRDLRNKRKVPMPGTRAYEDDRIVEVDKEIEQARKLLRQLKHKKKMIQKEIETEE